jgi:hypothetical protein
MVLIMRDERQHLQVRLPIKLVQSAKIKAIKDGLTLRELVETALRRHLQEK